MHPPSRINERPTRRIDGATALIATAIVALLLVANNGAAPATDAAPPPSGGFAHGAAGSGRNGFGGSIAPSPTMRSWPGTGGGGNGGPFSFIGAHYGSMWQVPTSANNSHGVGYCVMEDVGGEGAVSLQPDPAAWDAGEMARAAALMSSFGGDRVVPYGIDATGSYDVTSGEWKLPALFGGGEYTRRRHVAVNFGVKMFVEDVSQTGTVAGLKLSRDTAVVGGSGADFSALRSGYEIAQRLVVVAETQHAVGGVRPQMHWDTAGGTVPTEPGTYPLQVRALDAAGKPVGFVPVVVLSDVGIGEARTHGAAASVDRSRHSADQAARWAAAESLGWPTMDMAGRFAADRRFALATNTLGADVTDATGVARFDATITDSDWQLAFHTQAPTAEVSLYAGTGIQGQITWSGPPQSASVSVAAPARPTPPTTTAPPATTTPPTTTLPPAVRDVVVRKRLDASDVQGERDMSGFEFEVTADDDTPHGRLTTGPDGITRALELPAGAYTVVEVATPPWADDLADSGPVSVQVEPDDRDRPVEVAYTNVVPDASITTAARDAHDGDQTVDLALGGATVIDTVAYQALVPGTEYTVAGELMLRPPGSEAAPSADPAAGGDVGTGRSEIDATVSTSTVAPVEMIATGITGSTTFVPSAPDGDIAMAFDVPVDSPLLGHTVVVYQRLMVAASGRVVAIHADPNAVAQTIEFTERIPTTTTATSVTTTIADTAPEASPPTTSSTTRSPQTTSPQTTPPPITLVEANPPPITATTTTVTVRVTSPATQLPRTGGVGSSTITAVGLAIMMIGCGLVLTTVRQPSRRRLSDGAASVRHEGDR